MIIRKHLIFSSMLVFASSHAVETSDSSLLYEGVIIAASDNPTELLKSKAINAAGNYVEKESKNYLSPYLNSLEISVNSSDIYTSSYEIIGLKAYDNNGSQKGYLFNQFGVSYFDKRTTLNLWLGDLYLTQDVKWLFGANIFYDTEVSDQHERAGAGLEIKSSVFKLTYNLYDGMSDYKTDRSGTDSKPLDGSDVRFDLTLPYLPGAAIGYKKFKWEAEGAATDFKGEEVSLKGKLSQSFHVDAGRTFYDDRNRKDDSWIKITYQVSLGEYKNEAKLFDFSKQAYKLTSIKHERYKPVQRENKIIKQKQFAATVSGN